MDEPVTRRRLPGTRWRLLANAAPTGRGGMYGQPTRLASDDNQPTVFDELVVDQWLHIEQMTGSVWWVNIGGVTLHVKADRDGRPTRVGVHMPGCYDQPRAGCQYALNDHPWSSP